MCYFYIYCICLTLLVNAKLSVGQFHYHERDEFDEVKIQYDRVTAANCQYKSTAYLYLNEDTVSHIPDIKEVNINPIFPNRTGLLHIHNMAHSRAFFYSYVLQSRFKRPTVNTTSSTSSEYDPGFMYYFLAAVADVASHPKLNASAVYFQPNMSYTSSYKGFVNKTMPLFAPRAFRMDDYNDPVHLERISTLNFFQVDDLGAIKPGEMSKNYTADDYRINEWYYSWLPYKHDRQDRITTYQVRIRYANNTNETFIFHGPNAPDENPGPVKFGRPYFDCGRSDKWSIPAMTPIADLYPRHTQFRHIEYPSWVGITVMETDFERLDINQCPPGQGNDGLNKFADTAKCKTDTTECEPLDGYGFRRGGYQCRCRPTYRLPNEVRRPYLGELLEKANYWQKKNSFNCEKIGFTQVLPVHYGTLHEYDREYYLEKYLYVNISGSNATKKPHLNVDAVVDFLKLVKEDNCKQYTKDELTLTGDIIHGIEEQFENEARMAVRLANFLSAFLQIVDHNEIFSGVRVVDRPLDEDQMMGEVLSLVLGNSRIWAAGMYWDRKMFTNRTLFAPLAFKEKLNTRNFRMEDMSRLNETHEVYTNQEWFRKLKNRWSTNFDDLEKHWIKLKLRQNATGMSAVNYERYPMFYKAADLRHGEWSRPMFDCEGPVKRWITKYSAPFFGWDSLRARLEFKGAVQVTVDVMKLDINQCPSRFYSQNAFHDTHKCDRKTSYCVPIQGRGFETGGYKCECIQGYEYPFQEPITYYDGQVMEAEFLNVVRNKSTRFDFLQCRIAGASSIDGSFIAALSLLFTVFLMHF